MIICDRCCQQKQYERDIIDVVVRAGSGSDWNIGEFCKNCRDQLTKMLLDWKQEIARKELNGRV